jgi:hypothetical protein
VSQKAFLEGFDEAAHAAFAAAGMAGTGTYTAPGELSVAVPCRCYVDKARQRAGEFAPVYGARITVDILIADVPAPAVGGTLVVDGDTLVLEAPDAAQGDDGIQRWVVRRV